jgi:hypothetical protein
MPAIQMIVDYVQSMDDSSERLVLIVGKPGSGKSKIMRELGDTRGWSYTDCQNLITDELLEQVPKVRPREAPRIMGDIIGKQDAEVILLDGVQVLFSPFLYLDPLALLKQLCRKRTIVAAWPGQYQDGVLSFAEPGNPGFYQYDVQDLKIIEIG